MSFCLFALKRVSSPQRGPDYIRGTALTFILLQSLAPAPFFLVSPTTLIFLIPVLLRILSIERRRQIKGKIMHWCIKLVHRRLQVWLDPGLQDSILSQTCLYTCPCSLVHSLSLSLPFCLPSSVSWCFLFIAFHLSQALSVWQHPWPLGHQQPQDYLIPDKKSIFPRAPEAVPERPWMTQLALPSWALPDSLCISLVFCLCFSPHLQPSLCLPLPVLELLLCSEHGFSAKKLSRIIFSIGRSGSRFIHIFPHGSQVQPCSTDSR